MKQGDGGPFAALVAKEQQVIAVAWNEVLKLNDPTAHAEVQAIRQACQKLGTFQLTDCVLYSSCEPCPMCLGAIYWARPAAVYYAATRDDAKAGGFDDALIYEQIACPPDQRTIPFRHHPIARAARPFEVWGGLVDRKMY